MKKLLILGAGYFQKFVIQKAKSLGIYVIGVDGDHNAVGKDLCDEFELCDLKNSEGCLEIAKRYDVDGVLLVGCDAIETVAVIEEWLGITGGQHKIVASDKFLCKEILKNKGLNVPKTYDIGRNNIVIKPRRGWGSRNVKKFEYNENMCIEEYIDGAEITIDGLIVNKDVQILGISDKYKPIFGIAQHIHYPTNFGQDHIIQETTSALMFLKVDNCAFHIEGIMKDDKLYFIDIACRTTGGISTHIIPHISGTDFVGNIIKLALREEVTDYKPVCHRSASFCFIIPPEGKVGSIGRDDQIRAMLENKGALVDFNLNLQVGDIIKNPDKDSTRLGHYIINADTREEIERHCQTIQKTIKLEVT